MSHPNDKLREELAEDVRAYLASGGRIKQIPFGLGGNKVGGLPKLFTQKDAKKDRK